jgi:hypothetical protein
MTRRIHGPRQSGKTHELIKMSNETGISIVSPTTAMARNVERRGLKSLNPYPYSKLQALINRRARGTSLTTGMIY